MNENQGSASGVGIISAEAAELREVKARRVVLDNVMVSLIIGLIPLPLLDFLLLIVLQVRMTRKLGEHYGHAVDKRFMIQDVAGSLIAGLAFPAMALPALVSLIKLIPGLGTGAGMIAMPLVAAFATWGLGHAFIMHFESGNALFSLQASKVRDVLKAYYEAGSAGARPASPAPVAAEAKAAGAGVAGAKV